MRLKEGWLRATERALGQRYLLDFVVPGGTSAGLPADGAAMLSQAARTLDTEVRKLRGIYEEHAGVRDRFLATGTVAPELAARLGLIGLAGRASAQAFDLRVDLPCEPYASLAVTKCVRDAGDVLARVSVRFDELLASLRLIEAIVRGLPPGDHAAVVHMPADESSGIGLVEVGAARSPSLWRPSGRWDPPLPPARPVLEQLAGARARGDRQHRAGLPADQ